MSSPQGNSLFSPLAEGAQCEEELAKTLKYRQLAVRGNLFAHLHSGKILDKKEWAEAERRDR